MRGLLAALTVVWVLALVPAASDAALVNFTTSIDCAQTNAGIGTCQLGGSGTGSGTFVLDDVTGQVDFNISFSGLSVAELISHVHGPATPAQNAGVVYLLPLGSPKIGTAFLSASEMADMLAELHYVNIHSTAFTGGEIRGQVVLAAPEPTALALLALGLAGLAFTRRHARA